MARSLFSERDELLECLGWKLGRDDGNQWHRRHPRDASKVLHRIKLNVLVDRAGDGVPIRGEH